MVKIAILCAFVCAGFVAYAIPKAFCNWPHVSIVWLIPIIVAAIFALVAADIVDESAKKK